MENIIDKISLKGNIRKKKWALDTTVEKEIVYNDLVEEIRFGLNDVKVLETNKKRGFIRVVLMGNNKDIIERIEEKIKILVDDKEYVSCLMNVDGKDILNLASGESKCARGMDIDCEVVIKNIQMVDNKCTCGIILESCVIRGEVYGEILDDEYF
jgi:hypothetical protein